MMMPGGTWHEPIPVGRTSPGVFPPGERLLRRFLVGRAEDLLRGGRRDAVGPPGCPAGLLQAALRPDGRDPAPHRPRARGRGRAPAPAHRGRVDRDAEAAVPGARTEPAASASRSTL